MTRLINGRTPEQHAAWNRWHLIVAMLLALLLLLLWLGGKGPGYAIASGGCCGVAEPATAAVATPPPVAAPVAPPAAPADSDGDGVTDEVDRCANTPAGDRVGSHGCSCDVTVQLQYEFDSDRLTAEDKIKLDAVAQQLRELTFESGEVGGYTDNTGDDAYNLDLSKRRAQSALDYLASLGIAPERMTAVGHGEANPIADNSTPEGQALNRRAVIRRTDCGPPPHAAVP